MELQSYLDCCGLREMSGIAAPAGTILKQFGSYCYNDGVGVAFRYEDAKFRHVIFSQAGARSTYGVKLAAFITRHKLGTVVASPTKINPNSGNPLKVWIWTVNHQRTYNWWKEHQ